MMPGRLSRRQAAVELGAWAGAGAFWVLSSVCSWPLGVGIAGIGAAVLGWAVLTWRRGIEGWRDFGLRTDNLRDASAPILGFTSASGVAAIGYAWAVRGGAPLSIPRETLVLLPIYPLWGTAQQLVIQGIVHRRVHTLWPSRWGAIVISAFVFAALHVADPRLFALTLAAGLVWSWLFSRWPNVWLLGLSHGVLAALAYPLLLGEDPLASGSVDRP
jgi:membrane protease YdiL (CAAX protease family)